MTSVCEVGGRDGSDEASADGETRERRDREMGHRAGHRNWVRSRELSQSRDAIRAWQTGKVSLNNLFRDYAMVYM